MSQLRPIPGHPGYLAGADGTIWSTKVSLVPRQMSTFIRGRQGHLGVNLTQDGKYRMHSVHRLIALAWIGEAPSGHVVMHLDDCPSHNEVVNLAYGLPKDNSGQMVARGRQASGDRHGMAKLCRDQVIEIRRLSNEGRTGKSLAEEFRMSRSQVSEIIRGISWRDVA